MFIGMYQSLTSRSHIMLASLCHLQMLGYFRERFSNVNTK